MAAHPSIPAWRISWTEEPGGYSPWGHKEWDTTEHMANTHNFYGSSFPMYKIISQILTPDLNK